MPASPHIANLDALEQVVYDRSGPIRTIRLNRPEKLNAFGRIMKGELRACWKDFVFDPEARVAILTGTGRAFCAGRDIKEHDEGVMGDWTQLEAANDFPLPNLVPLCDKPIICALNGLAVGAGAAMMYACDIKLGAASATIAYPQLKTGILGNWSLAVTENIPVAKASYMILSGDKFSAQQASDIGIISKVVADDQLMAEARRIAEHIITLPQGHVTTTMALMHKARPAPSDALEAEYQRIYSAMIDSPETMQATRAFLDRRG
jgi:enoyl-CoA hydratase/carnithine racemase